MHVQRKKVTTRNTAAFRFAFRQLQMSKSSLFLEDGISGLTIGQHILRLGKTLRIVLYALLIHGRRKGGSGRHLCRRNKYAIHRCGSANTDLLCPDELIVGRKKIAKDGAKRMKNSMERSLFLSRPPALFVVEALINSALLPERSESIPDD